MSGTVSGTEAFFARRLIESIGKRQPDHFDFRGGYPIENELIPHIATRHEKSPQKIRVAIVGPGIKVLRDLFPWLARCTFLQIWGHHAESPDLAVANFIFNRVKLSLPGADQRVVRMQELNRRPAAGNPSQHQRIFYLMELDDIGLETLDGGQDLCLPLGGCTTAFCIERRNVGREPIARRRLTMRLSVIKKPGLAADFF